MRILLPFSALAHCVLRDEASSALQQWKAAEFQIADSSERNARALALADCLGNADPFFRDDIAFEVLFVWMRGNARFQHINAATRIPSHSQDAEALGAQQPDRHTDISANPEHCLRP